jgi:hypothetical protein
VATDGTRRSHAREARMTVFIAGSPKEFRPITRRGTS